MTAYLLAGPAQEPVSLAETKVFLRVDGGEEDGLISTLIAAARLHIESLTNRVLIEQTWRVVLDCWPPDRIINLPVAPFRALVQILTYDLEGTSTALALAQFQSEAKVAPARLFLPPAIDGAPVLRARGGIEIDYVAGYGVSPQDVPVDLRQALITLVAYWFEHRDAVLIAGSGSVVPTGFDTLVLAYRTVRL